MVVDPFAVSYGHADAAVGGGFPELVVFRCRNIIDAGGPSRNAVEKNAGISESCAVLSVSGFYQSMPAVLICELEGSDRSRSARFSRGADKGAVRDNVTVVSIRCIYGNLAAERSTVIRKDGAARIPSRSWISEQEVSSK